MSLKLFANNRLAYGGTLAESTPGTLETSADSVRLNATSIAFQPQTEQVSIFESGRGEPSDRRTVSTHVTGTITYPIRFADLDEQIRRGFRDAAMPAEAAVAATVTITASGASHLDGTTGAQIRVVGTTGAFDALKAASSKAFCDGLLLWIYGSANDDWNQVGPKMCKPGNPRDDGADTVIDLYDEFFQASSGFGAAFTGEVAVAVTVDAGAAVHNTAVEASSTYYSLYAYYPDVAKWVTLTGVKFGPPTFAWTDRGIGTMTQSFIGQVYGVLTDTNPNSGNSISDSALTWDPPIIGGVDLDDIYLGTPTQGLQLDGCFITNVSVAVAGDWTPVNGTLGSESVCGYIGPAHDPSASFDYHVDDVANATAVDRALQTIANNGTREKCTFVIHGADQDGNMFALICVHGEPQLSTVNQAGADSDAPAMGTFNLGVHSRGSTSRSVIWQRRALGEAEV